VKNIFFKSIACILIFFIFILIAEPFKTLGEETQKFRLGIIGLKHAHAWSNLRDIAKMPDVEVVGIAESTEMLQNEAKKYLPDVTFFDDYKKMVDETKPEAVWAFVENNRHLDIVADVAYKKIHIIFEKPLASTYADAKEMLRIARQHSINLMTNYQMAWWSSNYVAYDAVSSGRIGKIWRVHAIIGHGGPGVANEPKTRPGDYFLEWLNDEEKNGGGAIVDFGCYGALWACWFLGKPESVQAMVNHKNPTKYNVDDNSVILCKYPHGVAILEGSWSLPKSYQDLEIFGDKGSLYVTRDKVEINIKKMTRNIELPTLHENEASPIAYLIDNIRKGVLAGGLVGADINLDVVEILEAARISIQTGTVVPLPLRY